MVRNASARLRKLRLVHNRGASGSLRVVGSTRFFRSLNSVGSTSVAFFRPPPGRRTRPEIVLPAARSSSSRPRRMVLLARPVMRDTAETPPRPAMRASAAANRRRTRSSRTGSGAEWRNAMAASSITRRVQGIFGPRRNRQNAKSAIRLFINRS